MIHLPKGQFYGQTTETVYLDGITLTDTAYTHEKVDWHYHENPYFTFILQGNLIEGNKKEVHHCPAGSILFHNWQEPHYNIKPKGYTRGFHIELEQKWVDAFSFDLQTLQGNILVSNPKHKLLLYKIFVESKFKDNTSDLSIQGLLLEALASIQRGQEDVLKNNPSWVKKAREFLHDQSDESISLTQLAQATGIHPGHLSRDFSRYFYCSFGEYIRKIKIEQSLPLISNQQQTLTDIAFTCGFADQSHFIRCFKAVMGISPLAYRKMLLS